MSLVLLAGWSETQASSPLEGVSQGQMEQGHFPTLAQGPASQPSLSVITGKFVYSQHDPHPPFPP